MPRTRQEMSREAKVEQILEATERRLRKGGYDAVSVADIARDLEIAHNAVYWYFPSKDHLVVATFEHIITKLLKRKPKNGKDTIEKIMWFVTQLGELYPIRASLHERSGRSGVIADYLSDLNSRLRTMGMNVLRPYVPETELELTVDAFLATVQGAFVASGKPRERTRVVRFALERLVGPPAAHKG